jgi:hypothetical protein
LPLDVTRVDVDRSIAERTDGMHELLVDVAVARCDGVVEAQWFHDRVTRWLLGS